MKSRSFWDYLSIGLALGGALALGFAEFREWRPRARDAQAEALPSPVRGRVGVVVIFRVTDCESYRNFLDSIEDLEQQAHVPVVGVPVDAPSGSRALRASLVGLDPTFQLAPEARGTARALLARTGFRTTPVAILFDSVGHPVMVIPPHPSPYRQAEFVRLASTYAAMLAGGPRS